MKSINEANSIIDEKSAKIAKLELDLEKAERENWLKKKEFELLFQKKDSKNNSIYMDFKKLGNDKNTDYDKLDPKTTGPDDHLWKL